MLTPAFELRQNEKFLFVCVQIPYAKISDIEVQFEDYEFMLHSKPYFLRLNLPGKVQHCEEPEVQYDVDQKTLTTKVPKAEVGEIFEGLEFLTSLLAPRKKTPSVAPLIEVIGQTNDCEESSDDDWSFEQLPVGENFENFNMCSKQCGFANSYSFAVFRLKEETMEIFDVMEPESKTQKVRGEERLVVESNTFDQDYYLADLYDNDEIQQLLKYCPEWEVIYNSIKSDFSSSLDEKISFTTEEKERLRRLPNKEYLCDKRQVKTSLLGLFDIIFAYAYNKRTTEGENTAESPWTINKLSATLCWLETFSSLSEVACTCLRRSLCYPLFRHFGLAVKILCDVQKIFSLGKKYVLKCLLEIHEIFCLSEPRYILNDLYITDYCVWIQNKGCSSNMMKKLVKELEEVLLAEKHFGHNPMDFEYFAYIAWMDHNETEVVNDMNPTTTNVKEVHDNCDVGSNSEKVKPCMSTENYTDPLCFIFKKLEVHGNQSNNTKDHE